MDSEDISGTVEAGGSGPDIKKQNPDETTTADQVDENDPHKVEKLGHTDRVEDPEEEGQ